MECEKHALCVHADRDLARLRLALAELNHLFDAGTWPRLLSPLWTVHEEPRPALVQAQYTAMQHTVAAVRCYVALHTRLTDLPLPGEDGRVWLHGFLSTFRSIQNDVVAVSEVVGLAMLAFLILLYADAAQHDGFAAHYCPTFAEAHACVRADIAPDADDETWFTSWKPRLDVLLRTYPCRAKSGESILLGVKSLGETAVVGACVSACRAVLRTWDATHGLTTLPRTRRVLEVLAAEMLPHYDAKRYQLTHLFSCC